ncbi:MAG TPA: ABC transporter permease [Candidatus Eisenbacteria bacterium]|nr:ABC transporter permease [Candidatus Eisenbacteria bacterium]
MSAAPALDAAAAARPRTLTLAEGVALNLRATRARAFVRVVGSMREPSWFFSDGVLPNLGMAAYVLLYRALHAGPAFETLAVVGGILSTYWINVLWGMGAQFYWEKQQGQLALLVAAPCSRMSILTGMAVGGAVGTVFRSAFGVVVGVWLLHVRFHITAPGTLLGIFVLTLLALYALGMTLSSVFLLFGREAWHISNAVQQPVTFVSGLYFPLRTLGPIAGLLAGLVPLGMGVDALRQVLLGAAARGLMPVRTEAILLALLTVAFLVAARFALEWMETLSKREGRLTQRWQ